MTRPLEHPIFYTVGLVYVYVARRADCNLAGALIERDGFELRLFVDIDGLDDMVRRIEDYERIARDVGLQRAQSAMYFGKECRRNGSRTMIWRPSHSPCVTACSFACGRPGRMSRMGSRDGIVSTDSASLGGRWERAECCSAQGSVERILSKRCCRVEISEVVNRGATDMQELTRTAHVCRQIPVQ